MSDIPVHQRGYTNPHLLAETDWLEQHLGNPNVRIVDARPPQQYGAGHILGAVNLSGTNGIPRAADGEMASPEEFSVVAGKLGIGNGGTIILYNIPNQHMGLVAWVALRNGRARGEPSPRSRQIIPRRFSMRNQSKQFIARSAMPRRRMPAHNRFSGIRAVWLNFTELPKGTGSLHPGRDTLKAQSIWTGSNLLILIQRPLSPRQSYAHCWNRKALRRNGK
jgi:rhodanese-related sulfurtransferase